MTKPLVYTWSYLIPTLYSIEIQLCWIMIYNFNHLGLLAWPTNYTTSACCFSLLVLYLIVILVVVCWFRFRILIIYSHLACVKFRQSCLSNNLPLHVSKFIRPLSQLGAPKCWRCRNPGSSFTLSSNLWGYSIHFFCI